MMRKVFGPSPVPPSFEADFPLSMALRPSQIRASAGDTALMIPGAAATVARHGELAMPVFILAGAGDRVVDTQAQSGTLHANVPGSTLRVVEGAGHMIHHIDPDAAAAIIREAAAAGAPAALAAPAPG